MAASEHRLDVACRLAILLVDEGSALSLHLLDELDVPIAVFSVGQRAASRTNAAWRTLFGRRDVVDPAAYKLDSAKAGTTVRIAELAIEGGRPCYVTAMLRVCPAALRPAAQLVVACVDITDEGIARQLGVREPRVLLWSGDDNRTDYFSRSWSGYCASTVDWLAVIEREDRGECTTALASAIRERTSIQIDARIRRADGMYRWHRIRFTAPGSRWFASAVDIHDSRELRDERDRLATQLIEAKSEAQTASRLKDQFLAAMSHELRAPLTTIALWIGVLQDATDPALRAKALEVIRLSVLGQSRVVGDLLDISRGVAGKLHVDLRAIDLGKVVGEALESFAPAAAQKGITFEHRAAVDATVNGDAARLRQVIDNLLSNAIKFTDRGGTVTVRVARRKGSIVIEIDDTGCGIAPDLLPRLFEPFSQAQDSLTRGTGGLGLGLTISKQLVDLHGGTLSAASEGPGRGATFTLTVPALARRTAIAGAVQPRKQRLERTRVLVVDDDRRVLDALAVLLDRAGAIVDIADSAAAARDQMARGMPDVVVCDIAMPGEDGYSFMRGLRATRSAIGAIALTAHASDRDVETALAAGFDRHLAKPIDFERLVASIGEVANARRVVAPQI